MSSLPSSDPRSSDENALAREPRQAEADSLFHRFPRFTLASVAVFGIMVVLLVAEIGARILLPSWAPRTKERALFWQYDETLGWAHVPNQKARFSQLSFSVEVANNSLGLRDDEYSLERTQKNRMLVLGDSFTWGFGVEHRERFSELIEVENPNWEIINAGVSSYGTDQELLYYRQSGKHFNADVILVLVVPNDFTDNVSLHHSSYSKPRFVLDGEGLKLQGSPSPPASPYWKLSRELGGRSYLGSRLHVASHWYRFAAPHTRADDRELTRGGQSRAVQLEVTRRLVADLASLCKAHGSKLALVSVPMKKDGIDLLERETSRLGIPYLPLDDHFRRANEMVTLKFNGHWSARGHELAAEAIGEFLLEQGLL